MKTKTSLSLSREVLAELDSALGTEGNRSAFIESLIRRHFRDLRRAERDRRDAEIYARIAARDHAEAAAFAELQPDISEFGDDAEVLISEVVHAQAG